MIALLSASSVLLLPIHTQVRKNHCMRRCPNFWLRVCAWSVWEAWYLPPCLSPACWAPPRPCSALAFSSPSPLRKPAGKRCCAWDTLRQERQRCHAATIKMDFIDLGSIKSIRCQVSYLIQWRQLDVSVELIAVFLLHRTLCVSRLQTHKQSKFTHVFPSWWADFYRLRTHWRIFPEQNYLFQFIVEVFSPFTLTFSGFPERSQLTFQAGHLLVRSVITAAHTSTTLLFSVWRPVGAFRWLAQFYSNERNMDQPVDQQVDLILE